MGCYSLILVIEVIDLLEYFVVLDYSFYLTGHPLIKNILCYPPVYLDDTLHKHCPADEFLFVGHPLDLLALQM